MWLVTGAGAVAAILWELAEYQSFVQKVEQLGIYRDTVGDLCLGTSGALVAGLIIVAARPLNVSATSSVPSRLTRSVRRSSDQPWGRKRTRRAGGTWARWPRSRGSTTAMTG